MTLKLVTCKASNQLHQPLLYLMNFDFVLFRGSNVFFPNHALERIGRSEAVDRNEDAFGKSRSDASDSRDDHGSYSRNDRRLISE